MRPDRFTQLLLTAARQIPGVTAEPVTVDGRSQRPYLIAVTAGGKTTRWQVTATSAPGDRYDQPEKDPVHGEKPTLEPRPAEAGSAEHLEGALLAAVLEADRGEIASVDAYSRRPEPGAIRHGATIGFHDGSKIYLNHV